MENKKNHGKTLRGKVISNKMKDTVVVSVSRFFKIPKYEKYIKKEKKYSVHSPNKHEVGDFVSISECRPISKTKKFRVITK